MGSTLAQIIDVVKLKSSQRINFHEAKLIINSLNQKLNRKYDERQAEKFLKAINLGRNDLVDINFFKKALLKNLET